MVEPLALRVMWARQMGKRIKIMLRDAGLTMAQIRILTGVSWEPRCAGKVMPSALEIAMLCELLDIPADYLFGQTEQKPKPRALDWERMVENELRESSQASP